MGSQSTPGAIDQTAAAFEMKRVYGDMLTDLFASHTMTYNQFIKSNAKASVQPRGAGYYFGTRQADIESVGGRQEGGILPEPLKGDGVQGVITPKAIYGTLRLSGLAMAAGDGDIGVVDRDVGIRGNQDRALAAQIAGHGDRIDDPEGLPQVGLEAPHAAHLDETEHVGEQCELGHEEQQQRAEAPRAEGHRHQRGDDGQRQRWHHP